MHILIQMKQTSGAVWVLGEADVNTKSEVQETYLGKPFVKDKGKKEQD